MAKITYTDKVALDTPGGNEENQWRDNNANEVKTIVNENAESHNIIGTVYLDKTAGNWVNTYSSPTSATIAINATGAINGGCAGVWHNGTELNLTSIKNLLITGTYLANSINLIWFIYDTVSDIIIVNIQSEFILQGADSTIFMFEDNFSGITIDLTKWNDNQTANCPISQNNNLTLTPSGSVNETNYISSLVGKETFVLGTEVYVTFDIQHSDQNNSTNWEVGITKDVDSTDTTNRLVIANSGTAGAITQLAIKSGESIKVTAPLVDISTTKTIKLSMTGDGLKTELWSGSWSVVALISSSWDLDGEVWRAVIANTDTVGITDALIIDNFIVTDTDFLTQRP